MSFWDRTTDPPTTTHVGVISFLFCWRWETMISLLSPSIMKKKNEISPILFSQLWKWDSFHQKETMTIADYRTDSPPVAVCMLGQTEPFFLKIKVSNIFINMKKKRNGEREIYSPCSLATAHRPPAGLFLVRVCTKKKKKRLFFFLRGSLFIFGKSPRVLKFF